MSKNTFDKIPSDMMNTGANASCSGLAEDRLHCLLELWVGILLGHTYSNDDDDHKCDDGNV